MDRSVVYGIAVAEAVACVIAISIFLLHGLFRSVRERKERDAVDLARDSIIEWLASGDAPMREMHVSARQTTRLVMELASAVDGDLRVRLGELAASVGLAESARRWCGSRRWWLRLKGARVLTVIGGGEDVMTKLFLDPVPVVRMQAAEWAGRHPTPAGIDALMEMLDDDVAHCRFAVRDALIMIGSQTVEPLAARLIDGSEAALTSVLMIAPAIGDERFTTPALALCDHPSSGIRARALELVVRLGGAAAGDRCRRALVDPNAEVRVSAARGIGRFGLWEAAPGLARLLRDPIWEVRRGAGLALRELGGTGNLLLRRALDEQDEFARDMARHVLDLPIESIRSSAAEPA